MVKSIFDSDYGKEIEVVDQEDEEEEQKKVAVRSIFDPPEEAKPPVLDLEATETPRVDVDYEEETRDLSQKKTFQEFVTDRNFLREADLYMQSRFGKDDGRQADESDKEFTKRLLS